MEGLVSHAEVVSLPGFQRIMMDVGVNVLDHFFKCSQFNLCLRLTDKCKDHKAEIDREKQR